MPTYDYVCDACGHRFEEMQSFSAEPLKVCPSCGEEKLRTAVRHGGGHPVQGRRLLRNRLSQRFLQNEGQSRF